MPGIQIPASKTIKDRKPYLKLCPNHYKTVVVPSRVYPSLQRQPAKKDGHGWYK